MTIDLTGIHNENEFYTHHYLSAILEEDLKDVFKNWKQRDQEEKVRPPYTELRNLHKDYFSIRNELEKARKVEDRLAFQREFAKQLVPVLGYEYNPRFVELADETLLPILGEVAKPNGAPDLWVLEALDPTNDQDDPLTLNLTACQYVGAEQQPKDLLDIDFDTLITKHVFGRSEPPRWVLLVSSSHLVLIDRGKWNEKRLLRFDLGEILGRREPGTLQATAALLHRDSVCPADGLCLLDSLDENSHKHAHAVSDDLKYALREAIELLGNEVVFYLMEKRRKGVFSGEEQLDPKQLTIECLRYMYRLLFLFYIEARPELGYAPMKAEAYRLGYSLESLRDLELVKLTTEESKNGYFIHESLQLLFNLIYNGFQPVGKSVQLELANAEKPHYNNFQLTPLKAHLFDPKLTELINKVKLRNSVLQRILELMSLSRSQGRRERRGRISYSHLGINQLGAVYEALLSFSGFFAQTDLYEVKKAEERYNELETAYFVKAEDLEKYTGEEKVYNTDGTLKKFEKGRFIYRLAGRDREKSASYYTPEVLTQCLVKYALKELLGEKPGDKNWKTADEILSLTVCEPAMGSAAFLNEAINQLSEAYLSRKQQESGYTLLMAKPTEEEQQNIPDSFKQTDDYATVKQRVKMFIADRNVFGVDLNPVAVELAEVSLWLNTISKGNFIPWFGNQLVCGNSLVGARRQVFDSKLLGKSKKGEKSWLTEVPERVKPGETRSPNTVYHFLVPDSGMANYKDKVVKKLAEKEIKAINSWRDKFCKPFTTGEIETLERLSDAIDKLWARHTTQQESIRARTTDPIPVWGQPIPDNLRTPTSTEWKDKVLFQELHSKNVRNSSPYRRLKLVMDYWCALWFWPIEKADLLPTREEYLFDLSLILEGDVLETVAPKGEQMPLFSDTQPEKEAREMVDEFGYVNVDALCQKFDRLGLVTFFSSQNHRFFHWHLDYSDCLSTKDGFDLVVGNPPWLPLDWSETAVLSDYEASLAVKRMTAKQATEVRDTVLRSEYSFKAFLHEYSEISGQQSFLGSHGNYPCLQGMRTNLYKCFLSQSINLLGTIGITGMIHQPGLFDDPNGGQMRAIIYPRLRMTTRFQNWLQLFTIMVTKEYCLSVIGPSLHDELRFDLVSGLLHPKTVDDCYRHDGTGPMPGMKTDGGEWDLRGHRSRIVTINDKVLRLLALLYDEPGTPHVEARLPVIFGQEFVAILEKYARSNDVLGKRGIELFSTQHWNETNAVDDKTIKRETRSPNHVGEWIVSGPHIYVGNPFYKTPNEGCRNPRDYSPIDLSEIPDDYLPRTNYVPNCSDQEYKKRCPAWNGVPTTDRYRWICRTMIPPTGERTLASSIIPPGASHINGAFSITFASNQDLLDFSAAAESVVADFLTKTTGKTNFREEIARQFPVPAIPFARARSLRLNCLTTAYAALWSNLFEPSFTSDTFAKEDPRLGGWSHLSRNWNRACALRIPFERRQALVELDVIAAISLGLTLDELIVIYRSQFSVLRKFESETYYDAVGQIVFTNNPGLAGVGLERKLFEEVQNASAGQVLPEWAQRAGGKPYVAPFGICNREKDYEVVWAEFERRFKDKGAKA